MKILIVKLSSLGDVVHAMPAVQDLRRALPQAQIDWVVEGGFAPLVRHCAGVQRVICCDLRRWRRAPLQARTRSEWRQFRAELQAQRYDAVIDLQGLSKSALVARLARLAPGGHRYALGNRTEGAGWEPLTRWLADRPIVLPAHIHAVTRSRELCARAFGYALPQALQYGLPARAQAVPGLALAAPSGANSTASPVALMHGTSRADKLWPEEHWQALGERLMAQGHALALVHGSDEEEARSRRLQAHWLARDPAAPVTLWPRMPLDGVLQRLAPCAGAIGVDTGLAHLALGLDLPSVQIYRHPTAWRTGPLDSVRQRAVEDLAVAPVDAVWAAWLAVSAAPAATMPAA